MATFATTSGAAAPIAPSFGVHPAMQQQQQQIHHHPDTNLHHQHAHDQQLPRRVSQITLDQQHQNTQQQLDPQAQAHANAQQQPQAPLPAQQQPADSSAIAQSNANGNGRNGFPIGLGFLNKLGIDRKTNRDGQPAKRRGPKPDSKPALTRRQELNRQAQRTHRQRKEVYIKSLEDQVMSFKEHLAVEVRMRGQAEEEIQRLRDILQAHGIAIQSGYVLPSPPHNGGYSSATSDGGFGSASGDYATPSSYQASGSEYEGNQRAPASAVSTHANGTFHDQTIRNNPAENQLGIDFVLALEAFCNDHQQYLCVRSSQSVDTELPVASGHALMLSCPPLSHIESNPSEPYPHQAPPALPPASLASLLESSKRLPLNGDGEVTPIVALSMIQSDLRYPSLLIREFLSIQEELKEKTRCYGFGAVLEDFEVRDALENAFTGRAAERS